MNYNELTDFGINKLVAGKYLPCDYIFNEDENIVELIGVVTKLGAYGEPYEDQVKYGKYDPCNNPSDAWPIILENKIGIYPVGSLGNKTYSFEFTDYWYAEGYFDIEDNTSGFDVKHKNPLRAAMIVYLMMGDK